MRSHNGRGRLSGMATVSEALRRAIETCGMTRADLSRSSGVPESGISRFMAGESELRTGNVDRLAAALGLTLTAAKRQARAKSTKGR